MYTLYLCIIFDAYMHQGGSGRGRELSRNDYSTETHDVCGSDHIPQSDNVSNSPVTRGDLLVNLKATDRSAPDGASISTN